MQSTRSGAVAGAVMLVVAPIMVACSATQACSAIGGNDGVRVKLAAVMLSQPRRVSITACIDNRCRKATYDRIDKRFPTGFVVMHVPKDTTVHLRRGRICRR